MDRGGQSLNYAGMLWYDICMLRPTSIYLDTADMKKLERLAKKDGLKASYLVRKAIKEFLQRSKKGEK
jgi:predicted transcriptional regulator